jgi:hypothetical protein
MAQVKVKFNRGVEGATNIVDAGTEGTRVATGTNAQRGTTQGQLRFNTTTGLAEYYTGTAFKSIDAPPTVSSVGNTNIEETSIASGFDLTISGSGFNSGATVKFIGNDATEYTSPTVTVNSDTSITARVNTSLTNANEPFDVKVTNTSGLSATLADAFNVDASPVWQTTSGTLATIIDTATGTHATVSATDPEGDTVSYSETGGTVLSTNNFTLNSSTGAITGDPVNVSSSTTHTFNLRATSGTNNTDRSFNIIVNPTLDGSSSARASTSIASLYDLGISNGLVWFQNANINSGNAFQIRYASYNNKGWFEVLYSRDTATSTPRDHWLNKGGTNYTRPQMYDYNLSNGGLNYSSGDSAFIKLHSSLGLTDVAFTTKSSVNANGVTATGQNLGGHYPLVASNDIIGTDASTIKTQLVNYFGGYGEGFHAGETNTADYTGGWRDPSNTSHYFEIVLCFRDGVQSLTSADAEWHIVDGDSSATSNGGTYASNYGYRESGSYPASNVGTMTGNGGTRYGISSSNVMSIWVTDE